MRAYLFYWTAEGCWEDGPLLHAASNQFEKLHIGDHLYIITRRKTFEFVGRLVVARIEDLPGAARYLRKSEDELWDAAFHALADRKTATAIMNIPCETVLKGIYVISAGTPKRLKEPFSPMQFQTMREISVGSGRLFDALLK